MADRNSELRWTRSGAGPCKSSSAPTPPRGSRFSLAAGWSNAPLHGSDAAAGWLRIGNKPSQARKHGYSSLIYAVSQDRSEEHTSELQSLMRISYAVFCLKKKTVSCIHIKRTLTQY